MRKLSLPDEEAAFELSQHFLPFLGVGDLEGQLSLPHPVGFPRGGKIYF